MRSCINERRLLRIKKKVIFMFLEIVKMGTSLKWLMLCVLVALVLADANAQVSQMFKYYSRSTRAQFVTQNTHELRYRNIRIIRS